MAVSHIFCIGGHYDGRVIQLEVADGLTSIDLPYDELLPLKDGIVPFRGAKRHDTYNLIRVTVGLACMVFLKHEAVEDRDVLQTAVTAIMDRG